MSETIQFNPEHLDPSHEISEHATPEKPGDHEVIVENLDKKAEHARTEVEQTAESALSEKNRIEGLEQTQTAESAPTRQVLGRELEAINLNQMFRSIRRHESRPERTLSRFIHQPVIRVASEITGQTISRPSGLLGGGLVALLGTTVYLLVARHMGFRYNYLVFLVLFAGGFAVGIVLELFVWLATRSRRHATE
jgi:hypothetical protein